MPLTRENKNILHRNQGILCWPAGCFVCAEVEFCLRKWKSYFAYVQLFRQSQWKKIFCVSKVNGKITCLGIRASLKQGSLRSSLRNHFLQRPTISGWCSTSSSNALEVTDQTNINRFLYFGHIGEKVFVEEVICNLLPC